jgi:hypothetical protein
MSLDHDYDPVEEYLEELRGLSHEGEWESVRPAPPYQPDRRLIGYMEQRQAGPDPMPALERELGPHHLSYDERAALWLVGLGIGACLVAMALSLPLWAQWLVFASGLLAAFPVARWRHRVNERRREQTWGGPRRIGDEW